MPGGEIFTPETAEAERRSAERAPLCPDGSRAESLRRATSDITFTDADGQEQTIEAGRTVFACGMSYGVVFMPPLLPAVLTELLFPEDWTLLPPG